MRSLLSIFREKIIQPNRSVFLSNIKATRNSGGLA